MEKEFEQSQPLNYKFDNSVARFVENYEQLLKPNQIRVLKRFSDDFSGFKLITHEMRGSSSIFSGVHHIASFGFKNEGIEGQIRIVFGGA